MLERTQVQSSRPDPFLVTLNYFPVVYLAAGAALVWHLGLAVWGSTALALAWLYLIPPVICRLVVAVLGPPLTDGAAPTDTAFRLWWFLTQLQMPFNRIGLLEELLRLVPGLYGLWLNLWGSRVSVFAFWARDVLVSERYLIEVGPGVVLGSYSGLSSHLVDRTPDGNVRLIVAPAVVDAGAIVGIRAGVGPGSRVAAGEVLPAGRLLPPFCVWQSGRKHALPTSAQ